MPRALNASTILARAVGLAQRAQHIAAQAPDPSIREGSAAVELDASNIRALLSDTLRASMAGAPTLAELEERLRVDAQNLDGLEDRLRSRLRAPRP
jgi:hypothetical protein